MIEAGKLRSRITILERVFDGYDDCNQPKYTFKSWAENVRAEKVPLSGRELFAAQQVNAKITDKYVIHWRSGIQETWRFIDQDDGREWNIERITPMGYREGLALYAYSFPAREE